MKTLKKIFLISKILLILPVVSNASFLSAKDVLDQGFFPSLLVKLDKRFSHHVLIAEKLTSTLFLYQYKSTNSNNLQNFKLIKTFKMATGLISGDKLIQGDKKTPEGIYFIQDFFNEELLYKKFNKKAVEYGIGAFTLNYPNLFDKRQKKTGSGIWIHSTNNESRINRGTDSRGCIVLSKSDIYNLSKYLELNKTPVIIVQQINYLREHAWNIEKQKLEGLVNNWLESWINEDISNYQKFYDPNSFLTNSGNNLSSYISYKKAVFNNPGSPKIKMKNLSILNFGEYAVAQFEQFYKSNTIEDTGKKVLYLKKNSNYDWKIIAEKWSKVLSQEEDLEMFSPSLRFFNHDDNLLTNESK